MKRSADVAVIGIGSVGSMALWRLAERGLTVHGFEQFWLGHDRAAAGGETRMFRSTSPREALYVDIAARSRELWDELEGDTGYALLTLNGELTIGPDSSDRIKNVLGSISDYALPHELLDARDVRHRYPQHRMEVGEVAILDPNAGYIRSELAVLAASLRAVERGALVHKYTQVLRIEPDADGVNVVTWDGTHRYEHVLVTGGPWTGHLIQGLKPKVRVKRPVQAWFAVSDSKLYSFQSCPNILRPYDDGFYGFPSLDGTSIKIGLNSPNKDTVADPDHLDRTIRTTEVKLFSDIVRRFLHGVHPDPIRVAAYMEGYTVDNRPLAGHPDGTQRVTILGGFSGLGFKYAPAFGEAAADVVTVGDSKLDLRPFSLQRDLPGWEEEG